MKNILVIMPFKLQWSQRVWETLERIAAEDTTKQLNIYRVDMTQITADDLDEHIEGINRNAHIILADLTGGNPNVLLEVGFALALGKPLLLITQDRQWVPAHLQGRIVEEYDASDEDSLERLKVTMRFRIKDKLEVLEAERKAANLRRRLEIIYNAECYARRAEVRLEKFFRDAEDRIDILTTNLAFLFEQYSDSPKCYFDDIKMALDREKSKTKVRILTLDPESDFASKRGKQLGYAPFVFREQLRKALEKTRAIAQKYPSDRFEVRTYDDFPNQITYRIDEDILHCLVAQPTQSRNHLTFKLNRQQAGVDNSFTNHFQNVWGRSGSV